MTDWARFERAVTLRDNGRIDEAVAELEGLISETLDAEDKASLILNKVTCFLLVKQFTQARRELEECRKYLEGESPLLPRWEFLDASVSVDEGRPMEAVQKLEQILSCHARLLGRPDMRDLYENVQITRAMLLVDIKRSVEARPVLEEALSYHIAATRRAKLSYYLGLCYFDLDMYDAAKERLQEALDLGIDEGFQPHTHFYLGLIFERQSAKAWAIQHFEACQAKLGKSDIPPRRVYEHLCALYRAVGNRKDAEHYEILSREK
jgi:tetratricopeptide (TPR) repeat protein